MQLTTLLFIFFFSDPQDPYFSFFLTPNTSRLSQSPLVPSLIFITCLYRFGFFKSYDVLLLPPFWSHVELIYHPCLSPWIALFLRFMIPLHLFFSWFLYSILLILNSLQYFSCSLRYSFSLLILFSLASRSVIFENQIIPSSLTLYDLLSILYVFSALVLKQPLSCCLWTLSIFYFPRFLVSVLYFQYPYEISTESWAPPFLSSDYSSLTPYLPILYDDPSLFSQQFPAPSYVLPIFNRTYSHNVPPLISHPVHYLLQWQLNLIICHNMAVFTHRLIIPSLSLSILN